MGLIVDSKLLGQAAPANTSNATIYTRPANTKTIMSHLVVCNVTGTDATFRVFHDDDGSGYGVGNALWYDAVCPANKTRTLIMGEMNTAGGVIGVRTGTADALTFTLYGSEVSGGVFGPGRARRFVIGETDWMAGSFAESGTTWSIAAWIRYQYTGSRYIFGIYNGGGTDGMFAMLTTSADKLRSIIEQDNGLATSTPDTIATTLDDGEWHLCCASVTASAIYLWLDGSPDSSNPYSQSRTFPTITQVGVGVQSFSSKTGYWDGDIDECSFWDDHLLTDAEVAALWTLGNDNTKRYLESFTDSSITVPTNHWSLSIGKNPLLVGRDQIGSYHLTDNGTEDVEGIPAGD